MEEHLGYGIRQCHLVAVLKCPFRTVTTFFLSSLFPQCIDSDCRGASGARRCFPGCPGERVVHRYVRTLSESSPARASLFTGLDPCVHGLWTNGVKLPPRERTFPEILARAGYANWLVGRRQLAGVSNWTTEHARQGEFAHFEWAHGPLHRSRQNAYLTWLQRNAPECHARIFPSQANADDTNVPPEQQAAMSTPTSSVFNHWVGVALRN